MPEKTRSLTPPHSGRDSPLLWYDNPRIPKTGGDEWAIADVARMKINNYTGTGCVDDLAVAVDDGSDG
jgi:hypothetical protein